MRVTDVQHLLHSLILCADRLDRSQVKQLFRLLIAVGRFPICPACHQPITSIDDFTWDHIWPASKGGSNDLVNMQPMHRACNEAKGCQIYPEYLECQLELTLDTDATPPQKKHKKSKNRNVARYKPSQGSTMGFCNKNKRSR